VLQHQLVPPTHSRDNAKWSMHSAGKTCRLVSYEDCF